ncbi:hypothetical protein RsS62_28120 [Rhizobium dioscoreae]|nr:hypothetical protein RsS62_28120 [Rhizobium dioscoreae]
MLGFPDVSGKTSIVPEPLSGAVSSFKVSELDFSYDTIRYAVAVPSTLSCPWSFAVQPSPWNVFP